MSVTKTESQFNEQIIEAIKEKDSFSFTKFQRKEDNPDYVEFETNDNLNTYYIRCNDAEYLSTPSYTISAPPMTILSHCEIDEILNWIEEK